VPRKRIALSMRKDGGDAPSPRERDSKRQQPARATKPVNARPIKPESQGAFGSALADALKGRGKES
jgi:uncharacterized protein